MFLFEQIEQSKKFNAYAPLPDYIGECINPNFPLRQYQIDAFRNFITYFENENTRRYPTQTLFHMATGSGKTLMMAGLIIYLFKQGYRNFLFFVHLDNIIRKTKDNFINSLSSKYLFADEIRIDGEEIRINEVDNFEGADSDSINICFTTIQGLHISLNTPKENSITIEDFIDKEVVLISDEAHHINVETKKGKLTKEEAEEKNNWEYSVNRIFGANKNNVMLEFTATCDLENPYIEAEYENKILFDYPLSKFREDGYSKEVKTLQSDIPLMDRALQAIILSQYRQKVFQDNGLNIKPVVLFKAAKIEESKDLMQSFIDTVKSLNSDTLLRVKKQTDNPALISAFRYFDRSEVTYEILSQELKEEFSEEKCISVNDKKEAIDTQLIVNSLEDKNNPFRAVFQVKKLDEGWDVLNLFDIVRLYETRDAKNGKPGKKTVAEAQLIGRGARYCPFVIEEEKDKFIRKFDNDLDNPLRICEELYYHCQYDSKYISELTIALKEVGIIAENSIEREYVFKPEFKQDEFYQKGLVFYNNKKVKSRNNTFSLLEKIREKEHEVKIFSGRTMTDTIFEDRHYATDSMTYHKKVTIFQIADMNYNIVHKALRKFPIFKFNTLKSYFPNLKSIREFIKSKEYIGNTKIDIESNLEEPSMNIYYDACVKVAGIMADSISDIEITYEGTKEFACDYFHRIFKDNQKVNYTNPSGDKAGIPQSDLTVSPELRLDLSKEDWYVFNDNYGTSEEKAFVKYFHTHVEELKKSYDKVYLVRNERKLKIYSFVDGQRFEPDYLLFLHNKKSDGYKQMQIFIEPKGAHLIKDEIWKENLMLELKDNAIPVTKFVDDNEYKIWGFPFYNRQERSNEFSEAMDKIK